MLGKGNSGRPNMWPGGWDPEETELLMACICADRLAVVEYALAPFGFEGSTSSFNTFGAFSWAFSSRLRTLVNAVSKNSDGNVKKQAHLLHWCALLDLRTAFACDLSSGCCFFADVWELFLIGTWRVLRLRQRFFVRCDRPPLLKTYT